MFDCKIQVLISDEKHYVIKYFRLILGSSKHVEFVFTQSHALIQAACHLTNRCLSRFFLDVFYAIASMQR